MTESSPRFWEIFFEVFLALPRQGPGNRACAAKAFELCRDLPSSLAVLDVGCGVGGQTLYLAEYTSGHIIALDSHAPCIERLKTTVADRGLAHRVQPLVGDMAHSDLPAGSFDLIWSEGALYNIGIEKALAVCHRLLRPHGYLAFTDAVWQKENPPDEVKQLFLADSWTIDWPNRNIALIEKNGFSLLGHFTLPDEAWWGDFYTPMERRIQELRSKYSGDTEALDILSQLAEEPQMHRKYSDYYAYEFFVARKNK